MKQIQIYVLPAFDVLSTRDAILKERRNYQQFDIINGHLICLEEAMMYGKMGDMEKATECFNQHYKKYLSSRKPNVPSPPIFEGTCRKVRYSIENINLKNETKN